MVLLGAHGGYVVIWFINCFFSWAGGSLFYKRSFAEFLAEFRELDYFMKIFMLSGLGSKSFFKRARMPDALQAFVWVSRNWDPLKSTRRLPRVDPFESGHDNFIGIRAPIF